MRRFPRRCSAPMTTHRRNSRIFRMWVIMFGALFAHWAYTRLWIVSIVNCLWDCLRLQPVPILDSISEHEKYGNNGDKFDGISRSLVNGYEAFSNILNAFIQVSLPTRMCRCAVIYLCVCVCKFSFDCAASLHVALHKIYHHRHHHHRHRHLQVTIKTTS